MVGRHVSFCHNCNKEPVTLAMGLQFFQTQQVLIPEIVQKCTSHQCNTGEASSFDEVVGGEQHGASAHVQCLNHIF